VTATAAPPASIVQRRATYERWSLDAADEALASVENLLAPRIAASLRFKKKLL